MADLSWLKQDYTKKPKEEIPLMLDEAFPPAGTITMKPEDPTKGIPLRGATKNAQGNTVVAAPVINTEYQAPTRLEELKRVFTPVSQQSEIAPEASATQLPVAPVQAPQRAVSDTAATQDISRQASEMMPKSSGWAEFLPALAPLLTEALMGGGGKSAGESYGISGNYLVENEKNKLKRAQTLEDKLLEIQKARAVAGAKAAKGNNFQSVNIVDPETQMVIKANYDKNTGAYTTPDGIPLNAAKIQAGYSVIPTEFDRRTDVRTEAAKKQGDYFGRGIIKDPETGLLVKKQDSKLIPIQASTTSLNPKLQKDAEGLYKSFLTTDTYKKAAGALGAARNIAGLLDAANSGNASASESAKTQLARMSGDVGALSDSDISRYGGSPSLKMKAKRFTNLQRTGGPLLAKDIEELRQIAAIYEKANKERLFKSVEALDESFVKNYGGPKGSMINYMKPYAPELFQTPGTGQPQTGSRFPMQVRKDGKIATISNEDDLKDARIKGWQ